MNFLAFIICIMHCIFVNIKNDAQLSKILRNMPMLPLPRNTNYYRTLLINKKKYFTVVHSYNSNYQTPHTSSGGGDTTSRKGATSFEASSWQFREEGSSFFFVISLDALVIPSNKKYYCCSFTYFIVNRVTSTE